MKILDIVKFNNTIGLVVDELSRLTYEKHGDFLIGTDDSGILVDCLKYERPIGRFKAFAGAEFDLPMVDGSFTHCNGQYWHDEGNNAAKILNVSLASIVIQTLDKLKGCYVFTGIEANKEAYMEAVSNFLKENQSYEIWGYWEYKYHIIKRCIPEYYQDKPTQEFQSQMRKLFNAEVAK